ncbi:sugar transferase [Haloarculaceae archaeon H-GB2-1]|nr:sugar transferase [Haloarculaceae archaeon H-GB1-1]MEA5388478.1 sugar transferase [Haloarculaceae archaeon H-GB11]MEA5406512.1 sugar transferase [Haloarculaceae archaeon H-GB2-1]
MASGWRYRLQALAGTVAVTVAVVALANHPVTQDAVASLTPLQAQGYANGALFNVVLTTLLVVAAAMWPLFKPRPRRILDVVLQTEKRLFLAVTALATIGYFDFSYRLPRTTLIASTLLFALALPALFLSIRQQPVDSSRVLLVGDDTDVMADVLDATDVPFVGYVAPPTVATVIDEGWAKVTNRADGGRIETRHLTDLQCLGGLSRLDEVLVTHDVDTVVLAFSKTDRNEFFGTLLVCYDHGVTAKVHRDYADHVLLSPTDPSELVDVALDPWDLQDRVLKRVFDVGFALGVLLVLSPLVAAIAVAIKLDSEGPVLYSQQRTAEFGNTFTIYKFRSMVTAAEAATGARLSAEDAGGVDPRVTRVGYVLRRTHLDEIPQLWSILIGDMSVVGPRPERPELDDEMELSVQSWRQRWFVKPGLTGLAQIRGITGYDPSAKLRYDVEYIRQQSFWFDLKILVRQLWMVLSDARSLVGTDDFDGQK